MREAVIALNDFLFGFFVLACIAAGLMMAPYIDEQTSLNQWGALAAGGLGGFAVGAMFSGVWFVLSGIFAQLVILNGRAAIIRDEIQRKG
jgi:hypothetical protein